MLHMSQPVLNNVCVSFYSMCEMQCVVGVRARVRIVVDAVTAYNYGYADWWSVAVGLDDGTVKAQFGNRVGRMGYREAMLTGIRDTLIACPHYGLIVCEIAAPSWVKELMRGGVRGWHVMAQRRAVVVDGIRRFLQARHWDVEYRDTARDERRNGVGMKDARTRLLQRHPSG